ncbi:MAG: O-antigen ligase family protein, partial [Patescibacteria group bacterium]
NLGFSLLPSLSAYRLLKYLQLIFVISYFSVNFSPSLLIPLFFSLFLVSLLAWGQFLTQGSIQGVFWLVGERFFNLSTLGIAKMNLFGRLFARPMATFPHPNSLAGFVLVALIIFWFFRRFLVKKLGGFFYLGLAVMATVLVITFSGAVWLVIFLLLVGIYLIKNLANRFLVLILAGLLLAGFVFLSFQVSLFEPASINERFFLAQNAGRLFWHRPFLGWGWGSFIPAQGQLGLSRGGFNFYQPVHNLFLLALAEAGLWGLLCFFYWLAKWWLKVSYYWRHLFLVIAFLGFFDHYWLTLQQNFLLLGVVIAIALSTSGVERGEVV